ncbi:MAG TPA: asparagine synthase-related protein, partial [Solirubrobacteraceae bacterium]
GLLPDQVHVPEPDQRGEAGADHGRNLSRHDGRALRVAILLRSDQRSYAAAATRRQFGVDPRDPTADRRLVELRLTIPEDQYLRGGVYRSLVRRAMAGSCPTKFCASGTAAGRVPIGVTASTRPCRNSGRSSRVCAPVQARAAA